jgi:hypothetical protein
MREHFDTYSLEAQIFEADVHLLIRNTLHAALEHLGTQEQKDLTAIEAALSRATDGEVQQHLVDEHVDLLAQSLSQERFLRNMALVALSTLLTHALRKMARMAEHFCPSTHDYNGRSEFARLWTEYTERFSIDFKANAERIAFVESMRQVRNQIVHEGAEAHRWNTSTLDSLRRGEESVDTSFSQACPKFVTGEGWDAEVVVSHEQLDAMCHASIALVRWLATELDAQDRAGTM